MRRETTAVAAMEMDEYRATLWTLDDRGTLATYRLAGGELVKIEPLSPDVPVTAVSGEHGLVALGDDLISEAARVELRQGIHPALVTEALRGCMHPSHRSVLLKWNARGVVEYRGRRRRGVGRRRGCYRKGGGE